MRVYSKSMPDVTLSTMLECLNMHVGRDVLRIIGKIHLSERMMNRDLGEPLEEHFADLGVVLVPHHTQAQIDAFFAQKDVQNLLLQLLYVQSRLEARMYDHFDINKVDTIQTLSLEYNTYMRVRGH